MKAITLITAFSLITIISSAQVDSNRVNDKRKTKDNYEIKTLFGKGKTSHGGFLALTTNYTEIGNQDGLLIGGRGGYIMNHGFSIGIGGYALTTNVFYDNILNNKPVQFEMGYGGLFFEATVASKWPVHLSFPVLLGAGGAAYTSEDTDLWGSSTVDSEAFFVAEPGVNLEFNITKFFRMDFGLNYRWVHGINLAQTKDADLEGFSGGVTFKFGKF